MKKTVLFLALIITVFTVNAQQPIFRIIPIQPEIGDTVKVTYSGELAREGTSMSYIFHYLDEVAYKSNLIPSKLIGNILTGSFLLPTDVLFVTIKFENGIEYDNNNGKGFGFKVYDNGKPKKGTFFAQGQAMAGYDYFVKAEVDTLEVIRLMERESQLNPEFQTQKMPAYLKMLSRYSPLRAKAMELTQKNYDKILSSGDYEEYARKYAYILAGQDYTKSESMIAEVIKKYPRGFTALEKKYFDLQETSEFFPDTAFTIYREIRENFPVLSPEMERNVTKCLVTAYRVKLDLNNFEKYVKKIDDPYFLAREYNELAKTLIGYDIERAKLYSEKSLMNADRLESTDAAPHVRDGINQSKANYLDTNAKILSKLDNTQGAVENGWKSAEMNNWNNIEINRNLIKYLIDDKQYNKALKKAQEFIENNKSNNDIDSLYRIAFIANKGSEWGFDDLLSKAKSKGKSVYINELKKGMADIPAPNFSLKDLNGKPVSLSNFSGKIVIVDLWATWCAPCIASFPTMQKIMNELKDESVSFLYINTLEFELQENRIETIKSLLESKKVDFQVLLDEAKDNVFSVWSSFNPQGIPVKFIIKDGKIRFTSIGYENDEKLIAELVTMVEILK